MVYGSQKKHASQSFLADVTTLLPESREKLQNLVIEYGRLCDRRKLKVNKANTKLMRRSRNGGI